MTRVAHDDAATTRGQRPKVVRLAPDVHARLTAAATERELSVDTLVLRAVDHFLDRLAAEAAGYTVQAVYGGGFGHVVEYVVERLTAERVDRDVADAVADAVLAAAVHNGAVVTHADHVAMREDMETINRREWRRWFTVHHEREEQLGRIQRALSAHRDEPWIEALAAEIGVLLLPAGHSLVDGDDQR